MGETGAEDEPRRSTAAAEQCGGDSGEAAVPRLIERATTSTAGEVDPRLLKAIKSTVRSSDAEIRVAVDSLMDHMKKPHSQVVP